MGKRSKEVFSISSKQVEEKVLSDSNFPRERGKKGGNWKSYFLA